MAKTIHLSKRSHTYKRMFLHNYMQYAFSTSLLIVITALLVLRQSYHSYHNDAVRAAASLAYYADDQLAACQKLSASVGRNERLMNLASDKTADLNFSQLDSTMLFSAQHDLVSAKALNRFAATLAVYLYNKEYVISDYGTITLESFYQSIFNMSPNASSSYLRPLSPGSFLFLPKNSTEGMNTPQHPLLVLSVINSNSDRYGNLFVFLDERQMQKDIIQLLNNASMEFYLFDSSGNLLVACDTAENADSHILLDTLLSSGNYQSNVANHSGFTGYAGYSKEFLRQRTIFWVFIFSGIWILTMFLGLIVTQTICRKNYAPIREIAEIVIGPQDLTTNPEVEYESLKKIISSIFEDKSLLEEQILLYRPLLVNSLLMELLEGAQPRSAILPCLQKLGIELPWNNFVCCCVLTDCANQDFLKNIAKEVKNNRTVCLYVTYRKHYGIFLINGFETKDCENACTHLLNLLPQISPTAFLGISNPVTDPELLGTAYQQAKNATEYLPLSPLCKGTYWHHIEQSCILTLPLPSCLKSLPASFGAGQTTEARNNLILYFQSICCDGLVKKEYLLHAKEQLLFAISRAEREQKLYGDFSALHLWTPDHPNAFDQLKNLSLLVCDQLEQGTLEWKEQQTQDSAQSLIDYLLLHLYDEDLSLGKLAEVFQISESSVSRKIKQITDCNFLDYISRKRIEYACSLLSKTDMSINDISKAAGYENDITFRRLFKKHMGITPGEYRRQTTNNNLIP